MHAKKCRSDKLARLRKNALVKKAPYKSMRVFGQETRKISKEVKSFLDTAHYHSKAEINQLRHRIGSFRQKVLAISKQGARLYKNFNAEPATLSRSMVEINYMEKQEYILHKCLRDLDVYADKLLDMERFYR